MTAFLMACCRQSKSRAAFALTNLFGVPASPAWVVKHASGSRFVETMLTIIETCRQQRRNVLDVITAAVEAHQHGQQAPSLLRG